MAWYLVKHRPNFTFTVFTLSFHFFLYLRSAWFPSGLHIRILHTLLTYGLDDWGSRVRFPTGAGIFLFTTASRTALGPTQPPIQWLPGALSLGVKRPGREADH
jgi:hypothetical protein